MKCFSQLILVLAAALPLSAAWVNVTSNLANMASECGNVTLVSPVPGTGKVIAGVAARGMWQSIDKGQTWARMGQGAGSDVIDNRPSMIIYDPANQDIFWEAGLYGSCGGPIKTADGGTTFKRLTCTGKIQTFSVDLSDPLRRTIMFSLNENHKNTWVSRDGGTTWNNVSTNLPDGLGFDAQCMVIDSVTYLIGCAGWGGGTTGIFRTENGGTTWTNVSNYGPQQAPLVASNGDIYWQIIYDNGIVRSTDKGKHWALQVGYGKLKTAVPGLVQLPDGRIVGIGARCLMGSSDNCRTWVKVGESLPFQPIGIAYSVDLKAFFAWYNDCGSIVPSYAIQRLDWDWQTDAKIGLAPRSNLQRPATVFACINGIPGGKQNLVPTGTTTEIFSMRGCLIERNAASDGSVNIPRNRGVSLVRINSAR